MANLYEMVDNYLSIWGNKDKYGKPRVVFDDLNLQVVQINWTHNLSELQETQKVNHSLPVKHREGSKFTITSGLVKGYYKNLEIMGPPDTGGQKFILKPWQSVTDYMGWVKYNVRSSKDSTFVYSGSSFCYIGGFKIDAKLYGQIRLENAYSGAFHEVAVENTLVIEGRAVIHWF